MSGNMQARNEPSQAVTKVAPSWLAEEAAGDTSTDALLQYRVIPRVKVLQGLSDQGLKDKFGEGSVVVQPGETLLIKRDGHFDFVPLLNFVEYIAWNDRSDKASLAIQARTFDPAGEIARRARDPNLREEAYGLPDPTKGGQPMFKRRYVEHLCFAGVVYGDHELAGAEIGLNFQRSEFTKGTAFVNAILMRRVNGKAAPLWSQVWRFTVGTRTNAKGRWFGLDFNSPDCPWIAQELAAKFRETHSALRDLHAKQRLLVDRADEADPDGSSTVTDAELERAAKF